MKSFNVKKFAADLVNLRGEETQKSFSEKLQINRSTLSLLETGKQVPSLDILNKVCSMGGMEPNEYFKDYDNNALVYLMGSMKEEDKEKINLMLERIKVKEKYEMLSKRVNNDINR